MRKWIAVLLVAVVVASVIAPAVAMAGPKKHTGRPVFVQHPYTAKQKMKVGAEFKVWGYVAPKVSDLTSKTVEIQVFMRAPGGSWVETTAVAGSLYNVAKFRNRTMYAAKLTFAEAGRYRIRAKYTWEAADGTKMTRFSSYKYLRAVK